jgi:hypothetical protein
LACLVVLTFHLNPRALAFAQQTSVKPLETTITELVASSRKFSGKRVHVRASYHSDGRENDVLMEPNCGTSKTNPPGESQCGRGVVPFDAQEAESDPGSHALDRALAQGERGTMDKYITAEFTGRFRCVPSCARAKWFKLEIERVENLQVEMKDLKPHRPTDQPSGTPNQKDDAPTSTMMR